MSRDNENPSTTSPAASSTFQRSLGRHIADRGEFGYLYLDQVTGIVTAWNQRAANMLSPSLDCPHELLFRDLVDPDFLVDYDLFYDLTSTEPRVGETFWATITPSPGYPTIQATLMTVSGNDGIPGVFATLSARTASETGAYTALSSIQEQVDPDNALGHIAEQLNSTLDSTRMLEIVTDAITQRITGSLTVVALANETGKLGVQSVRSGDPDDALSPDIEVLAEISDDVFARGRQRQIRDLARRTRQQRQINRYLKIRSAVATPIFQPVFGVDGNSFQHRCIGVLTVARYEPGGGHVDDCLFLRSVADILGIALWTARLSESRAQQARDLEEVQHIGSQVATSLDLAQTVQRVAASVAEVLAVERCAIRIRENDQLLLAAATGNDVASLPRALPVQTHLLRQVIEEGQILAIQDVHECDPARHMTHPLVRGLLSAPLLDRDGKTFGVLAVHDAQPRAWTDREQSLLAAIANTVSVAIHNARIYEHTRATLHALVESLTMAIDAKDPNTHNHSRNVAAYARRIAEVMNLPADEVERVELAGHLHDIGKIGIPDRVLLKRGPLDEEEWAVMWRHPVIGERILSGNPSLDSVLALVRHHHERWDGTGYPDRLAGADIPAGAAILGLAEAFDTMIIDRPYQKQQPIEAALAELRSGRGTQFSPTVVDAFLDGLDRDLLTVEPGPPAARASELPEVAPGQAMGGDARATLLFHSIAAAIRALDDLDTFLTDIVHTIRDVLDKPYVQIFALDDRSDDLFHLATLYDDQLLPKPDHPRRIGEGITGWVARHARILNVPDVSADPRYLPPRVHGVTVRSELAVPLIAEERVVGVINLESEELGAFTSVDEQLMVATASLLAQVIETARVLDQIRQLATTDGLTGLANHRTFYERLEEETRLADAPGDRLLAIAIFDVDNLKQINDTHGHLAGDGALREIAGTLRRCCRWTDLVCRYGGDEFAIIMPATDAAAAWSVLNRADRELAGATFTAGDADLPLPRGSWGIAVFPNDGDRPAELVNAADRHMYRNKHRRRIG